MNTLQDNICDEVMSYISLNRTQPTFGRKELYAAVKVKASTSDMKAALQSLVDRSHIKKLGGHIFGFGTGIGLKPYVFANGNKVDPAQILNVKQRIVEGERKLQERQQQENQQKPSVAETAQKPLPIKPLAEQPAKQPQNDIDIPSLVSNTEPVQIEIETTTDAEFLLQPAVTQLQQALQTAENMQRDIDDCKQMIATSRPIDCKFCGDQPNLMRLPADSREPTMHAFTLRCSCGIQTVPEWWSDKHTDTSMYSALYDTFEKWGYTDIEQEKAA